MSNNTVWVVLVLIVLVVGGWFMYARKPDSTMVVVQQSAEEVSPTDSMSPAGSETPVPTVPPKTITLEQTGTSGQSGSAVFEPQGDSTKVTLTMVGEEYTSPQPAHIHIGKCPNPGEVKYPLSNVVDGKSETVVAVNMDDLFASTSLPLVVNVHESVEKSSVYTACGDLF